MRRILLFVSFLFRISSFVQTHVWQPTNGPYDGSVWCLAGTRSGNLFAGGPNGIFRSSDQGNHWASVGFTVNNAIFAVAGDSSGSVLAGAVDGIYRSTDDGASWSLLGFSNSQIKSIAVDSKGWIFVGRGD